MAEVKQTCATCRWAVFEMTKHATPKPMSKRVGRCEWPVPPTPALPLSINSPNSTAWERFTRKMHIWPDYADCPVWEAPLPLRDGDELLALDKWTAKS
jgi:hypothetical protein